MRQEEIKTGDVVRVTREVTVRSLSSSGFTDTHGEWFRNADVPDSLNYAKWDIELIERPEPEGWPPQMNDVWETKMSTYHIHRKTGVHDRLYAFNTNGTPVELSDFKGYHGLTLAYRKNK